MSRKDGGGGVDLFVTQVHKAKGIRVWQRKEGVRESPNLRDVIYEQPLNGVWYLNLRTTIFFVLGMHYHRGNGQRFNPRNSGPVPRGVCHRFHKLCLYRRSLHSKSFHTVHGTHAFYFTSSNSGACHCGKVHFQDSEAIGKKLNSKLWI